MAKPNSEQPRSGPGDAVFEIGGLADFLKISQRTVWRKIATGEVPPPICIGRSKRWYRVAVESWLAERAAKAVKHKP